MKYSVSKNQSLTGPGLTGGIYIRSLPGTNFKLHHFIQVIIVNGPNGSLYLSFPLLSLPLHITSIVNLFVLLLEF
jgi:hypothetical protein